MNGYREFAAFYARLTADIDYAHEAEQLLRLHGWSWRCAAWM